MKKALLSLMLIGIFVNAYSQFIEKGSIIANGSFSFYSTKFKESEDKYSGFDIMPWAGYFIADNFAAGLMVEFDTDKVKYHASDVESTSTSTLFGPVVRYYLNNGLFVHSDLGFGFSKDKFVYGSGSPDSEFEYDVTQFRIGIGYAIRITDTVFLDPIIGFKSNKEKYDSGDDTETGIFAMGSFTIKLK